MQYASVLRRVQSGEKTNKNVIRSNTSKDIKVFYLRAAQTRVDPFSCPDALVVWRHVIEAGVDMEHEEEIADGPNHSDGKIKTSLSLSQFLFPHLHEVKWEFLVLSSLYFNDACMTTTKMALLLLTVSDLQMYALAMMLSRRSLNSKNVSTLRMSMKMSAKVTTGRKQSHYCLSQPS